MTLTAAFDDSGVCRIVDQHGVERTRFQTVYQRAYNSQYPPPVSPDGTVVYIGTWERGLFCYDVAEGSVRWRQGPGRVRNIFPFASGVVAELCGRGLYRRRQDTGELLGITKMSGIEVARRLGGDRLFAGPLRGCYFVFSFPELVPAGVLSEKDLNTDKCLTFVVCDASEIDGFLVVRGFEDYPGGDFKRACPRDFVRRVRARPV